VADLADELSESLPEFTPTPETPEPAAPTETSDTTTTSVEASPTQETPYVAPLTFSPAVPAPVAEPDDSAQSGDGSDAELALVPGIEGRAIRVTRKGNRERFAFFGAERLVSKRAGEPYKARALVRTAAPGMLVCLRVQEYGGGVPRTTERCAPARSGWRRIALEGRAAGKGHKLVLSVYVMAALGGTSFDIDGFRLAGD
jgi:hypothetical protein